MSFTGKATYSAGANLPESAEDVSDLIGIVSPHETPLLDLLGDPARFARSTVHEWLEDTLLPNGDTVTLAPNPPNGATFQVAHPNRFRVGDQLSINQESLLLTGIDAATNTLSVQRGYGGTTAGPLAVGDPVAILGNAALEGDSADSARFTLRIRRANYTQIFSSTVEISGSELAVRQLALADELDYQKQQRLRELLRDLENSVINGRGPSTDPQGGASVRRTMKGLLSMISTHIFLPEQNGFPSDANLTEEQLSLALGQVWKTSNAQIDTILVNADQKRAINQFMAASRRYQPADESFQNLVSWYESDFGVCRVVLSRWVPTKTVVLLDSTRIAVMPLAGRSFQYKPLAPSGDRECGQVLGEYTLEMRNENAHAVIRLPA